MENETKNHVTHCLVIPYPLQGHINPMLQFSKRLIQKGIKITLANTISISNTINNNDNLNSNFQFEIISYGFDQVGISSSQKKHRIIQKNILENYWTTNTFTTSSQTSKLKQPCSLFTLYPCFYDITSEIFVLLYGYTLLL